jgi:hypothetical protein
MIDAEKEEEEEKAQNKIKFKLTLMDFVIQHQVLNNRSLKDFRLRKKFVCYEGEGTTLPVPSTLDQGQTQRFTGWKTWTAVPSPTHTTSHVCGNL